VQRGLCEDAGIYSGAPDHDLDGVPDAHDNCPVIPNGPAEDNQADGDQDGWGDACDNCPTTPSSDLSDHDGDGEGSACDDDDDDDGILDIYDDCPYLPMPPPDHPSRIQHVLDDDFDGSPNACDPDDDNDGVPDGADNCPDTANADQADLDGNGLGDACERPRFQTAKVYRVRQSRPSQITHPDFNHWVHAGVPNTPQKHTYISFISEPPKPDVRHLVFVSAGQQGSTDGEYYSGLTGQQHTVREDGELTMIGYKHQFPASMAWKVVDLYPRNMVDEMLKHRYVVTNKTYIAAAFDARFDYNHSVARKDEIEDAFYAWLSSKFDAAKIESITLMGHSRGGCLVQRLGKRFQNDLPNVPLIIQSYDGVCKRGTGEFGATTTTVDNPKHDDPPYFSYALDFDAQFAPPSGHDRSKLRVYNLISGEKFLQNVANAFDPVRSNAHVFTPDSGSETLTEASSGVTWFEQEWSTKDHMNISGSLSEGLSHYQRACTQMAAGTGKPSVCW